jgi:hypothetical protein
MRARTGPDGRRVRSTMCSFPITESSRCWRFTRMAVSLRWQRSAGRAVPMRGQPFEVSTRYLGLADKSARTVATLTETLNRHRGKGQQTVRVEHVTVNGASYCSSEHAMRDWIRRTVSSTFSMPISTVSMTTGSIEYSTKLLPHRATIQAALVQRERSLFNLDTTASPSRRDRPGWRTGGCAARWTAGSGGA